ncbi:MULTISPECIES: fatty acid desaturase [unclassified Mucilaginibacter]|uniref:fatty acid desaturase n=1 Tax=unclassified Mucilaginibacter TaxID=2617802 RepID=UPI000968698D|nr:MULTISPECIES: fatty acid desaturase [unclassified Mucilaginibacter]OJW16989.1 MAG: fatty acid desaturase [Mucilaginibacter sp. 44-25]PLW88669.1 MAG: fatty acid desaturase [Mucilaginibacter sp.]HEK21642.1 acyl-CoA desaturase [Bacteroidota bacterium]
MAFIHDVLEAPSYGWKNAEGELSKPTPKQILKEFFSRLNVFSNKKNWLSFTSWLMIVCLAPFLALFLFKYFTVYGLITAFVYSMVVMGTHGTIWYHRYCTHRAYKFKNNFWRFITQNLTLKIIPEEIYAISHHVHHALSDTPGDPYNAQGGFLYCFLADANHQPVNRNLSEKHFNRCVTLMKHTGVTTNTYAQYQKWGSIANPFYMIAGVIVNWAFWFAVFYLIGGMALACAIFGAAGIWAVGVRTFNYEGHGKGKDKRRNGVDHNRNDMSINQIWPGIVAGEWHNNHHLYPKSARSGFKPYQVDSAWYYIKFMSLIGAVSCYNDAKKQFYENYMNSTAKTETEPQLCPVVLNKVVPAKI